VRKKFHFFSIFLHCGVFLGEIGHFPPKKTPPAEQLQIFPTYAWGAKSSNSVSYLKSRCSGKPVNRKKETFNFLLPVPLLRTGHP
jgi:hypothetical protein